MTRYDNEAHCNECGAIFVGDDSEATEANWFWGGVESDKHMNYHRCPACGEPERVKVTYGCAFEVEQVEELDDRAGTDLKKHPKDVGAIIDNDCPSIDWSFMLTKEEAERFYNMMQLATGVDMQMMWNVDQGVEVDGEHYNGE